VKRRINVIFDPLARFWCNLMFFLVRINFGKNLFRDSELRLKVGDIQWSFMLFNSNWGPKYHGCFFLVWQVSIMLPEVNFINILRAAFVPIILRQKITKPNCN
jgi:hypothetical protein